MKFIVVLWLASAALAARSYQYYSIERSGEYFQQFIDTYDKHYGDETEKTKRYEIFKQNLLLINKKNSENKTAVYGINRFTDLTTEEFINTYTGCRQDVHLGGVGCKGGSAKSEPAPDSWDWKEKGMVSRAKDQRRCGSCWAFSAIGNVEALYVMKHKDMVDLSEQQLVDCDSRSNGCQGTTDMQYPFLYLKENSGSMQEQDYPYQSAQSSCRFDPSKVKAKVADCVTYQPQTEEDLKNIVYNTGPVSIGVDATGMQYYHGHVLPNCPFTQLNHAVLIVGYGTENNTPYWLIKNSWGEGFGENGFIKIKRGVNACGLMSSVVIQAVVN